MSVEEEALVRSATLCKTCVAESFCLLTPTMWLQEVGMEIRGQESLVGAGRGVSVREARGVSTGPRQLLHMHPALGALHPTSV